MQFIFHPRRTLADNCDVRNGFRVCTRPGRYLVDNSQLDEVATIIEVGDIKGEWVSKTSDLTICLHHASKVIQHDHSSFRVVQSV